MGRFRIYYDDGSEYSGDPFRAKPYGVQVIAQEDPSKPTGFHLIHGKELRAYFLWKHEAWWVADEAGFWDYMLMWYGPKYVLFGRTLRDEDYYRILQRAGKEGLGVD